VKYLIAAVLVATCAINIAWASSISVTGGSLTAGSNTTTLPAGAAGATTWLRCETSGSQAGRKDAPAGNTEAVREGGAIEVEGSNEAVRGQPSAVNALTGLH
jgi:hypothetical protein